MHSEALTFEGIRDEEGKVSCSVFNIQRGLVFLLTLDYNNSYSMAAVSLEFYLLSCTLPSEAIHFILRRRKPHQTIDLVMTLCLSAQKTKEKCNP